MGKKNLDDRPAYLTADDAKYSLGVHRGPLPPAGLDESSQLEHVESAGGLSLVKKERKKKEKFAQHWKRFWCCYLFLNIIFLAIFLPVFFTVAIPAISQMVVNKSDLVLVNAAVMQPRPDSIKLTLKSALNLKVALPVRIEDIDLNLFVRDTGPSNPWAQITIDGKTIKGNTTLGISEKHTPLVNLTTWTDYVHNVVFKKETALSIKGTTNSYLGVLKSRVTMDKDVLSPTLDSFSGFSISDTSLVATRPDGTNLVGNASLPNPSVLTLEIGTLVLDVKSGDLLIGNTTLENLELKPGPNVWPLTGILDLGTILKHLPEVIKSQKDSLSKGQLSLDTVTRTVTWNGTLVPYYTDVMKQLTLTANVQIVELLKNTIHNLLHSNTSLSDMVHSAGGNSSITKDILNSARNNTGGGGTSLLSNKLKNNLAVRNLLRDEHPVKRDSIIDSLVELYTKL
ncbi:hypothetical protein NUU61_003409 [Penicillium alfredii]|uniref:Uncharacterized protein n=1 Tax=Penicillium alfredii TaxID=1506179 RepID=A0A9W9FTI6_9EURO|nr:uncharacterized protein NUU61_003409 [Penicillium alfredii]KAJ5106062.1 hypothetical protein NUU61_003409 [Penicillium alfredii]